MIEKKKPVYSSSLIRNKEYLFDTVLYRNPTGKKAN